uniref:Sushi domain-containing protein n=1 Tax=Xiphophorus maculatus TaxID=8083 RepID=A0A3B5PYB9_XIPMA
MQTPCRKTPGRELNPGPSCCKATALPTAPLYYIILYYIILYYIILYYIILYYIILYYIIFYYILLYYIRLYYIILYHIILYYIILYYPSIHPSIFFRLSEGGNFTLTKKLEKGSLLIYRCNDGYYPYPALTRMCQPNGSWKPAPRRFSPQKCKLVECPDPNVMENGNVSPPEVQYFVGNETSYECYSGYTLRGSSKRICLPNGKWSGSTPICSPGSACPDPGVPPGASRAGNMFGIDDKVRYTCNGELFLVGSKERVCLENGQWTGTEPACYYDTQEGRLIRISKSGTLNIYIGVDISESIEKEDFEKARDAIITLIKKVRTSLTLELPKIPKMGIFVQVPERGQFGPVPRATREGPVWPCP